MNLKRYWRSGSNVLARHQPRRPQIAIIGAGTYGAVISELAMECGFILQAFLDDDLEKQGALINGVPVLGPIRDQLDQLPLSISIAVAFGDNDLRLHYLHEAHRRGRATPALIHDLAAVSRTTSVADGVYMHAGSHAWTETQLGFGSILSPEATVAHHSRLGPGCFVSTGAHIGASIEVDQGVMFGMGCVISTGVRRVGFNGIIGAGTTVIRDTEPNGVYVGSPARLIKYR